MARRVAKLEAAAPPKGCQRCHGKNIGVLFTGPGPHDYGPNPDGSSGPLPPNCPDCGRKLPKLYVIPDRKCWDGMCL